MSSPHAGPSPSATPGRNWYVFAWRCVRCLLVAYLLVLVIMLFLENWMIFVPINSAEDDWRPAGLALEDAWFQAADGTRLHGWYVPHPCARATVLFCHGNAGNVTHRASILRSLHNRASVSVLLFDYRGFGKSEGKPDEAGVLADARAARAWLADREKVAESDVVLMGESLGGAVAVDLAAKDGARALVLESTFSSIPDVAAYHFPWLPVRWLMHTRLDSESKIRDYHGPLLQSHAEHDTIVPFQSGRRLFEAANEPKQFLVVPGNHNDPRPAEYYEAVGKFLLDHKS